MSAAFTLGCVTVVFGMWVISCTLCSSVGIVDGVSVAVGDRGAGAGMGAGRDEDRRRICATWM